MNQNYRNEQWYQRMDPQSRANYDRAQWDAFHYNNAARAAGKRETWRKFGWWCLGTLFALLMLAGCLVLNAPA